MLLARLLAIVVLQLRVLLMIRRGVVLLVAGYLLLRLLAWQLLLLRG